MFNDYRNAIRDLIDLLRRRGQSIQYISWQVNVDEVNDPTLLSFRAYGSREYSDVVMVACGTSFIFEQLPETEIILPTLLQIRQLRTLYGLSN